MSGISVQYEFETRTFIIKIPQEMFEDAPRVVDTQTTKATLDGIESIGKDLIRKVAEARKKIEAIQKEGEK